MVTIFSRTNSRAIGTLLRPSVCLYILYRGPVHSLFAPRMYINILRTLVGKQTFLRSVIASRTSQCVKC